MTNIISGVTKLLNDFMMHCPLNNTFTRQSTCVTGNNARKTPKAIHPRLYMFCMEIAIVTFWGSMSGCMGTNWHARVNPYTSYTVGHGASKISYFSYKMYGPVPDLPVLVLPEGVQLNCFHQKTHLQVGTNWHARVDLYTYNAKNIKCKVGFCVT